MAEITTGYFVLAGGVGVLSVIVAIVLTRFFGFSFTKLSGTVSSTEDEKSRKKEKDPYKAIGTALDETMNRIRPLAEKDMRFRDVYLSFSKEKIALEKGDTEGLRKAYEEQQNLIVILMARSEAESDKEFGSTLYDILRGHKERLRTLLYKGKP